MVFPRVAVIIPAYREERLIRRAINQVPAEVAQIFVVDDASGDDTAANAEASQDERVTVLRHAINQGVGAAIYTGYRQALESGAEYLVVMAGDAQMHGADLPALLAPLRAGQADYVKGNRLLHPDRRHMPLLRKWGTQFLARLTSWATGQEIRDSQCGYTALHRRAALTLNWSELWPRYGYPNDLLIQLARRKHRIAEVPVRPIYADEQSGLRPWHLASITWLILRQSFHARRSPLVLEAHTSSVELP